MNYCFENAQNANFWIYKEIGALIKSTKLIEGILNFSSLREFLIYSILGPIIYLPQLTDEHFYV
jgi:hypothetical protein